MPSRRRRDDAGSQAKLHVVQPERSGGSATIGSDTPVEVEDYRNGGILHTVLRNMAKG